MLHVPTFDPAIMNIPRNPSDNIMIVETTQRYAPCKMFEFFAMYWLADVLRNIAEIWRTLKQYKDKAIVQTMI